MHTSSPPFVLHAIPISSYLTVILIILGEKSTNYEAPHYAVFSNLLSLHMNNAVFWYVAPCSSCVNRCFGGTYRLHLQGRKIRWRRTSVSRWLQVYILGFEPLIQHNFVTSYVILQKPTVFYLYDKLSSFYDAQSFIPLSTKARH
jgi:hypothetical protein